MRGYDIIGDVHGCASALTDLLAAQDYQVDETTGAFRHPERQAIFVGDLVDRGEGQLDVLDLVKRMVDSDSAQIVMGNHEFNAIAYNTPDPDRSGEYLRDHSEKNNNQHQDFLDQVAGDERAEYIEWFKSMPLWLDLGGLRVVHACWHEPSMRIVEEALGSKRFSSIDQFARATSKADPLYEAIEVLLKGPEIGLPEFGQPAYRDKDGHLRHSARVAWWREDVRTLQDVVVMDGNFTTEGGEPYPELSQVLNPESSLSTFSYRGDVPVFYGHYWRKGLPMRGIDFTDRTACVDFSAVKGGDLVAYRWDGESKIQEDHYFRVEG